MLWWRGQAMPTRGFNAGFRKHNHVFYHNDLHTRTVKHEQLRGAFRLPLSLYLLLFSFLRGRGLAYIPIRSCTL